MALTLGHIALVAFGCFALAAFMIKASVLNSTIMEHKSSSATPLFNYGKEGNPFKGFGIAGHRAPHELAKSVGRIPDFLDTITGEIGIMTSPMVASRFEREQTAVKALSGRKAIELVSPLLETPDLGSAARPSTPAVLKNILVDDASCLAHSEARQAVNTPTSGHGCGKKFDICHKSCVADFWRKPAPGACHLVCMVMKETCDRCTEKEANENDKGVMQRLHSLVSSTISRFSMPMATNDMLRNLWTPWTMILLLQIAIAVWIAVLTSRFKSMERVLEQLAAIQAEQAAMMIDIRDRLDLQEQAAERSHGGGRGLLKMGYKFVVGWTSASLRLVGVPLLST